MHDLAEFVTSFFASPNGLNKILARRYTKKATKDILRMPMRNVLELRDAARTIKMHRSKGNYSPSALV